MKSPLKEVHELNHFLFSLCPCVSDRSSAFRLSDISIFETNEGTNVTVGLQYSSTGSLIFSKPTHLIFSLLEFMLSSRIYLIPFLE